MAMASKHVSEGEKNLQQYFFFGSPCLIIIGRIKLAFGNVKWNAK